jgi:hypothetical protein
MNGLFGGIGLKHAFGLAIFVGFIFIMAKVVFNKYPVNGVTQVANML